MGPRIATGFGTKHHVRFESDEFFQDFDRFSKTDNIIGINEANNVIGWCFYKIGLEGVKLIFEVA